MTICRVSDSPFYECSQFIPISYQSFDRHCIVIRTGPIDTNSYGIPILKCFHTLLSSKSISKYENTPKKLAIFEMVIILCIMFIRISNVFLFGINFVLLCKFQTRCDGLFFSSEYIPFMQIPLLLVLQQLKSSEYENTKFLPLTHTFQINK